MKLLFVQGGSRVKVNSCGEYFVDGNFNNSVFEDYYNLADDVTFLLREDGITYSDEELERRFNKLDKKFNIILLYDFYGTIKNRFNLKELNKAKKLIGSLVKQQDKIIIRSIGNFYTNTVYSYCRKYRKDYLIEVTGFAFDGLWYHSWKGKLVAFSRELFLKRALKNAPYAVYVTQEALQKRYPCKNITLGCSDVRLQTVFDDVLTHRLEKINADKEKLVLGTAAFLDVKWKGQEEVIKAIHRLKKEGLNKYEYQLVGSGDGKRLKQLIDKFGLNDCVKIIGALPHTKVFEWLDTIDIYIQPSFQEGLCRSIVEAMSRGCPVVCSDVGGNYELIQKQYIFKKRDITRLCNVLQELNNDRLTDMAKYNFKKAQEFDSILLEQTRNKFYEEFINN